MKKVILSLVLALLFINLAKAQTIINVFAKEGKIFVKYNNGKSKEIVSTGYNTEIAFSKVKNFVVYQRIERKSKTKEEEGQESYDQLSIRLFNLKTNKDTVLFTTCLDGIGGTQPGYANSKIYPNNNLCGIESPMLSKDGERLYFQTAGWATCPAIHYYNLNTRQLVFFKAGWLQKVTAAGIQIEITGIDSENQKGRFTQNCLFDVNGNLIKELSEKEF